MSIRKAVLAVACLASIVGVATLRGADREADPGAAALKGQLNELLWRRIETAKRAFAANQAAYESETVTLSDLVDATNRLLDAELATAATPQEEAAALESHVERTRNTEKKIKMLYDLGAKGGEATQYFTAKRERESAEIVQLQARIKAKQ